MLIFQPVNWIESKYSVSFAWIKLGVIKRIFSFFPPPPFFFALALCIESDKFSTVSLISFYNDYNFFLESSRHDNSFNGARNELQTCFWSPHMTREHRSTYCKE